MVEKLEKPVRFGIVGCGVVSELHARALAECPYGTLAAAADLRADSLDKFSGLYEVPHTFARYEDMLTSDEIDVVCVCTPSGLHGEVTVAAARAGKHILCEKPLEINTRVMTEMIAAAEEAKVQLGVVYQRRAMPVSRLVKQAIAAGELGPLVLCDAYLKYFRSQQYYDSAGWRGTWATDGGGALMNQGVHGVDMIQWLAGGITSVFAKAAALARDIEVEDTAVAVVQFSSGAFGVIEGATTVYPERSSRFELHGELGTVVFDDSGLQEWTVLEHDDRIAAVRAQIEEQAQKGIKGTGHYAFIEDMALAVREGREPLVPGAEARKAVDVILAIYESARTGREVHIG